MDLKALYNRFRKWQQTPFDYRIKSKGVVHHCCNCDAEFEGNFCPYCGQRATVGPVGWKSVITGILLLWGMDSRSLSYTLLQLVLRPGYIINDYINGRRQVSFPPVKMLFILAVFYVLFRFLIGHPHNTSVDTNSDIHFIYWLEEWSEKNMGWASLLSASILILPTWITFRYSPKNTFHTLPQGFFIQVFLASLGLLISIISDYFIHHIAWIVLIFYFIAYKQLFGYSWWGTIWRITIMFFLTFIILCLGSFFGEIIIRKGPVSNESTTVLQEIFGITVSFLIVMIPSVVILQFFNKRGYKKRVSNK